ncbi:SGNH/GDSL hydrolase family protein [Nocardioides immobilis]|uniref:SGNH/GDSL hydrolase family protein n=1 Tax=Nocardioides immobilis TaxID=2049295 RepID=A0A417Y2D4_9ACTN|nr:SGNH/GDSL hydrolase family protein [Nocardioides immobilis]RHW26741.1 SGNH/GDSL hydrolase family protein [Nocardioides immobilis]
MIRPRRSAAAALFLFAPLLLVSAASSAPVPDRLGAEAPERVQYDVLGDSYGSGYGVPPYTACGRSESAYGVLVDGRQRLALDDFVACAGATTTSLIEGGQLSALDAESDLVLLSIGGNDIGWSDAVGACLLRADTDCARTTEMILGRIGSDLPAQLDTLHDQVAAAAPEARVIVTGYPRLFSPDHGSYLGASQGEQQSLNDGADVLNAALRAAAEEHGFDYVDVTHRFDGHGVNAPEPWILGLLRPDGSLEPGAFHPNAAGYEAYAAAVTAAIGPGRHGG